MMRTNAGILSAGVSAALVLGVSALGGGQPAGAVTHSRVATAPSVPVIVFLKSEPAYARSPVRLEQRAAVIQAAQAPYLSQLRAMHATGIRAYHLVDAFAARVPESEVPALAASPGVAQVIPDSPITGPDPAGAGAPARTGTVARAKAAAAGPAVPGACSATPQLEPEGLAPTGTDSADGRVRTARSLGYTGAGVKVAFLADGIDPANVNLLRDGRPVIADYQDFSGDGISAPTVGSEAFMDANAIAGQGTQVYNTDGFSAQAQAGACNIRIEGVAPGAELVALKVFSSDNVSSTSGFLQAIDYAVGTDHVNVLNESFGSNPFPDVTSLDAVKEFNDAATAAGVTVVVASGDGGPSNTIGSPASDPDVLSVGASTDFRAYAQTGYAAADQFARHGWLDDNISALSSGGYTQAGGTVDMVAPGDLSFASCTANLQLYSGCTNFLGHASDIEVSGGTSQSASEVAAAAALVIQAYRGAHGGASPPPATVRQILMSTATDLGAPATEQGAGMLNSLKAVELAKWMPDCDPVGETLGVSRSQLSAVGSPGTKESWQVTVTNTGATRQAVSVSGRSFPAQRVIDTSSVTLSDTASPHFANWAGVPSNYGLVRFSVPAGEGRLDASISWPAGTAGQADLNARVWVILVTPDGKLAADSLPQGAGGYGNAEVLHPAAGTWTAVIFSDEAAAGGTAGKVQFGASVAKASPFGSISPAKLTLAPGASGTVRISAVIPGSAGDSSGSVVLDSGYGATSIPVTLRGMVPLSVTRPGSLRGVLTGGDGRAPGEGQVAAYEFSVPAHSSTPVRSLEADVVLANDPANEVSAYLVAPGGQTMGYGSNDLTTGFTGNAVPVESEQRQLSVYTTLPVPGTWTLIIDFTSPVPGNELADPFTATVRLNATSAARGGLPSSASTVLTRGKAYTYPIKVTNTGPAPEDIFVDPRLDTLATYTLQPQDDVSGVTLPLSGTTDPPEWIVPTMTHSVAATASSHAKVMFDFGPFPGDPDTASSAGTSAAAPYPPGSLPTPVTQGLWVAVPSEVGPYPAGGAAAATATMAVRAVTAAFDTTVSSPWGDFWKFAVQPLASTASFNLLPIAPGQTRTIDVTIQPAAAAGTVVKGTLYVDDFVDSMSFLSGSQLAALPYEYKVAGIPRQAPARSEGRDSMARSA